MRVERSGIWRDWSCGGMSVGAVVRGVVEVSKKDVRTCGGKSGKKGLRIIVRVVADSSKVKVVRVMGEVPHLSLHHELLARHVSDDLPAVHDDLP